MSTISPRKSDMWIGGCLLVFCIVVAWLTLSIKSGMGSSSAGPSMIPWMMIGAVAFLSLVLIGRSLGGNKEGEESKISMPDARTLLIMLGFVLLLTAYAAAFYPVGYIPATLITFVVGLWLLGERRWYILVLFPLIMTFVVYFGFTRLLTVWLP
ncbi:putative tricarboxylic transport membrane protein [Cohaesibacter sp. ES.047]|uniref:tripartite tricarboxylate transporter TctB family protein n=1 Tax=Cohaesibacter sp. ES.047 TaxID=1798205 RepID=UPI000BB714F0|nr:tripartite tricarboxylate transporter TctB family protein [Cohaesibacter sp. ES.047]SNY92693.1 putative tricarboxylic transport membrane protein [Cohaesibacter sp. ES.047]